MRDREKRPRAQYQYKTKGDVILEILRETILSGELPPGAHLRQDEIAKKFATSSTPVREAFRHLQQEGLLLYHPHRGMRVAEYSVESIDEIYSLRVVIEPIIAGRACERITDAELELLEGLEDKIEDLAAHGEVEAISQVNHDFHRLIHIIARSRLLHEWASRLWLLSPVDTFWAIPNRVRASIREHREILAAFRQRDRKSAEQAERQHVISTWNNTKITKSLQPPGDPGSEFSHQMKRGERTKGVPRGKRGAVISGKKG